MVKIEACSSLIFFSVNPCFLILKPFILEEVFFNKKITRFFVFGLILISSFFVFSNSILAAACPVTDGGAGDADSTVNGVITIDGNTTWSATADNQGVFDCSDVSILVTGDTVLTLDSYDSGDTDWENDYGVTVNAINFTIDADNYVSGNSTGYAGGSPGRGPGGGPTASSYQPGRGGSFGGKGANGGASQYGNILDLEYLGSGGSNGYSPSPKTGGAGGGLIIINASGTVTINGTLRSNGGSSGGGGGGSGGAIHLVASDISGTGIIEAKGGATSNGNNGGGGGRVLVDFSDSISGSDGFEGTIDIAGQSKGGSGTAIVRNTSTDDIYIQDTQEWKADPNFEGAFSLDFGDFLITDNSILYLRGYYTSNIDGVGLVFNTEDFTIDTGSSINMNGRGYAGGSSRTSAGAGPGAGAAGGYGKGGGGGYGGEGAGGGGATYGSESDPDDLGSGGGGGYGSGGYSGGAGAGALKLISSGNAVINGDISANGNGSVNGGGGAGGSINISAVNISGDGLITANGGNSSTGGDGGGGRIALSYVTNTLTNIPTVTKGGGGTDGTYRTYGLPSLSALTQYQVNGTTVIDTGSSASSTTVVLKMTMSDADVTATLTPKVEVQEIGTDFTDTATHTGDGVSYSGSDVIGSVTVTSLTDMTDYHWQSQVCDETGNCTAWESYGANDESATDFAVILNMDPNDPTLVIHDEYFNTSQPGISFNVTDDDDNEQLAYQIQIDDEADFTSPLLDYRSDFDTVVSRTYTVGQTGGTYNTGSEGMTLNDGNYFYRVKGIDDAAAESDWVEGTNNPDFKIDTGNPNNATAMKMKVNAGASTTNNIGDSVLSNDLSPYFSWTSGSDADSGMKGYCLYLGTDDTADPATTKGILGTSPISTTGTTCGFITDEENIDFSTLAYRGSTWLDGEDGTYYFIVKSIDNARNTFSGANDTNIFEFEMDATLPTNVSSISGAGGTFSNTTDMYFNWPTSGNLAASDAGSGLLGWQYSINSLNDWRGTETDATLGIEYVPFAYTQPFNLTSEDADDVIVGDNVIYFRSVDNAGNYSSSSSYRTASISYGGEAPSFAVDANLTVTPTTNDENSFAFEWDAATASGENEIATYYYMINTTPPASLSTLTGNSSTYIENSSTSVEASSLSGVNKGSNTVYVVAVDDNDNYSPSNYLSASFTLDSELPGSIENLVLSDSSVKAASLWRASLAWDEPSYVGLGSLSYIIQRSDDSENWTTVGTTSGNAYVDTVPESKSYYWRVGTSDSSDDSIANPTYSNADSLYVKGSYVSAPSLSSGPSVSNITTKRAKVSWTTSRAADSKLYFGTESDDYADEGISKSEQVSDHSLLLNNLVAGTKYYYTVEWTDEDGNTGTSSENTFTTSPAPTVKDVEVTNVGLSQAIINFTVEDAHKVKIYYGISTDFGGVKEISTSTLESNYTVELSGLEDGTKYYYKINAFDEEDDEYEGTILDFETLPRPQVSNIRVQQVKNSASPSIVVTWESNTEISSIVTYYPEGQQQYALDQIDLELVEGEHQLLVRGLAADTRYNVIVKGRDRLGNEAVSDLQVFNTDVDTRPPAITDLYIEGVTVPIVSGAGQEASAQLIVSWDTDEPATSQVEFAEGTGTTFSQKTQEDANLTYNHLVVISGLSPSKVYHLRAVSKDNSGNVVYSTDTTTITPRATDNALNLVLSNLQEVFAFLGGI